MIKLKSLLFESKHEVYRGDDKNFKSFDSSFIGKNTMSDTVGFWFTDNAENAEFYGQYVRKFFITIENPMTVTSEEFTKSYPNGPSFFAKKAKLMGYDGVIIQNITDGDIEGTSYCVFSPKQIQFI